MLPLAACQLGRQAACPGAFGSLSAVISRALLQTPSAFLTQPAQFSTSTVSGSAAAAAAAPANAMQLIKDLRQQSGAPISDVKVTPSRMIGHLEVVVELSQPYMINLPGWLCAHSQHQPSDITNQLSHLIPNELTQTTMRCEQVCTPQTA
jgi:hypothetical protein